MNIQPEQKAWLIVAVVLIVFNESFQFQDCGNHWRRFKVFSFNIYTAKQPTLKTSLCLWMGLRYWKAMGEISRTFIYFTPASCIACLLCLHDSKHTKSSSNVCFGIVVQKFDIGNELCFIAAQNSFNLNWNWRKVINLNLDWN